MNSLYSPKVHFMTPKLLATIIICLLCTLSLSAQKKMNLYFKDGTSKTGYVEFKKDEVKFRAKQKGKKEKFDYAILDSAAAPINPRAKRQRKPKHVYFLPEGKKGKKIGVYEVVSTGKINLYKKTNIAGYSTVWVTTGAGGLGGPAIPMRGGKITAYALQRAGEPTVTILGGKDTSIAFVKISDSFKKHSEDYFSDCPTLVDHIKEGKRGFTSKELKKIVAYYNTQCE